MGCCLRVCGELDHEEDTVVVGLLVVADLLQHKMGLDHYVKDSQVKMAVVDMIVL